jgi:DNA repair protein RadD
VRLRDYQTRALDDVRRCISAGRKAILLVAPTGAGKTTIFAAMVHGASARGNATLFLAHRTELIDQCSERLDSVGVDHGVIKAGHKRHVPWLPVQVASVQTLVRRDKPAARLVVIDEAHRARAATYHKILDCYPGAVVVGLTATPWRTDGRGLGELFEEIVVAATPRQLIDEGWLVPFTGYAYDAPDLSEVKRKGNDFEQHGLEIVMGARKLAGNVVEQYLTHAQGKRGVLFAVSVKHSIEMAKRFREAGVAAEHVDGEMPAGERAAVLGRLRSGETTIACNVGILTEGFDLPALEVCILARPTLSTAMYLQMVGRVLRPAPGKELARIHDHAGCIMRHGLPDAERDYLLGDDAEKKAKGDVDAIPRVRTCPECLALFDPVVDRACPRCGAADTQIRPRAVPLEVPEAVAIPIEDIAPRVQAPESVKRAYYESQKRVADQRGYKPGWVFHRFKSRYGHPPPAAWRDNE